jgi:signal transduction histidine kinase
LQAAESYAGGRGWNAAAALLVAALVALRRRWAVQSVLAAAAVIAVWSLRPHDNAVFVCFVPLIVMTASSAVFETVRRALAALLVAETALVIFLRSDPRLATPGTLLFDSAFIALPWLAALMLRRRRDQALALADHLKRVHRERADRERAVLIEERARIARELHDIVAHAVSVMVVNVGAARMQLDLDPQRSREPLLRAEQTGRQALAELRRLLGVLRTGPDDDDAAAVTPQPDLTDLQRLAEQWQTSGVSVGLRRSGDVSTLDPGLQVSAFRIVQEALTNAVKHGPATRVEVDLRRTADRLVIEVHDDGTGRRTGLGLPTSGHGLIGMQERAAIFGGHVSAGPASPGGWQVRAELPAPAAEPSAATPDPA